MDSINHESGSIQPALSESSPPDHCVYLSPPLVLTNSPADRDDEGRNTEGREQVCGRGQWYSPLPAGSAVPLKKREQIGCDCGLECRGGEAGKQGRKKRKEKRK
ncbi:unnamed protein product [Arctogadus glacialis]